MGIKRAICIPDCHFGIELEGETSHDQRAFNLVCDIIKETQPDILITLGDFGEFACVSSHPKHPTTKALLKDEIYCIIQGLKQLVDAAPNSDRHFLAGNHLDRVSRYIAKHCPDLFDTIKIEELLKLEELGFKYYRYGPNQLMKIPFANDLYARHEPYGSSAQASARNAMVSLVHGHDHQLHKVSTTSADGRKFTSIGAGCLVNLKCKLYEYTKKRPNWQHGFVAIDILPDGTWFDHLVEIKNYKCSFDGSIWVLDE